MDRPDNAYVRGKSDRFLTRPEGQLPVFRSRCAPRVHQRPTLAQQVAGRPLLPLAITRSSAPIPTSAIRPARDTVGSASAMASARPRHCSRMSGAPPRSWPAKLRRCQRWCSPPRSRVNRRQWVLMSLTVACEAPRARANCAPADQPALLRLSGRGTRRSPAPGARLTGDPNGCGGPSTRRVTPISLPNPLFGPESFGREYGCSQDVVQEPRLSCWLPPCLPRPSPRSSKMRRMISGCSCLRPLGLPQGRFAQRPSPGSPRSIWTSLLRL
jgi:hypothetical protein